ncbi:MAG: lipid-A-disaccharide synthase N-terminal domain-containing protein [Pseudolabrys sp.]|nr:lipid-A-disaccharide synthase N-terminal domain-containing protein [Pseudolabrys sp.]
MLVELMRSFGEYLRDVFLGTIDYGIMVGYVAQLMFSMRFVVQWIASERAGRSVVPTAFWVFSIGGGIMLLGYAIYRKDPVFIIGQAFGVFVYLRNLQFVLRSGGQGAAA